MASPGLVLRSSFSSATQHSNHYLPIFQVRKLRPRRRKCLNSLPVSLRVQTLGLQTPRKETGVGQDHLEHHRDGLLACLGCPPFSISVRLEKVFCTVGLEIGMGKGELGHSDES